MRRFRTPAEVLGAWRSALDALAHAPHGSAEGAALQAEVDALRAEYHRRVYEMLHGMEGQIGGDAEPDDAGPDDAAPGGAQERPAPSRGRPRRDGD